MRSSFTIKLGSLAHTTWEEYMKIKKTIAVLIALFILAMAVILDKGVSGLAAFWNAPSFLFILIPLISILVLSDNLSELTRGFWIVNGHTEFTMKEFKSTRNAFDMTIKVVTSLSVLGFLIGFINMNGMLSVEDNQELLRSAQYIDLYSRYYAGFSIALLTIVYGIVLNIFLFAIRSRVNKEIIYRRRQ